MPGKNFTPEVLVEYQKAAIENAEDLYSEASLLLKNSHFARAYFLGVAALEEVGKAAILFQATGRNLAASDVQSRLRIDLQDHSIKITGAFTASLKALTEKQLRERLLKILDYAVNLKRGREPAMYSDFNSETGTVWLPKGSVRQIAATDCLRLASGCLNETKIMIEAQSAPKTTRAQDKLWALGKKAHQVWKEPDFGDFLLDFIERNGASGDIISPAVSQYYDQYLSKGRKFGNA